MRHLAFVLIAHFIQNHYCFTSHYLGPLPWSIVIFMANNYALPILFGSDLSPMLADIGGIVPALVHRPVNDCYQPGGWSVNTCGGVSVVVIWILNISFEKPFFFFFWGGRGQKNT